MAVCFSFPFHFFCCCFFYKLKCCTLVKLVDFQLMGLLLFFFFREREFDVFRIVIAFILIVVQQKKIFMVIPFCFRSFVFIVVLLFFFRIVTQFLSIKSFILFGLFSIANFLAKNSLRGRQQPRLKAKYHRLAVKKDFVLVKRKLEFLSIFILR